MSRTRDALGRFFRVKTKRRIVKPKTREVRRTVKAYPGTFAETYQMHGWTVPVYEPPPWWVDVALDIYTGLSDILMEDILHGLYHHATAPQPVPTPTPATYWLHWDAKHDHEVLWNLTYAERLAYDVRISDAEYLKEARKFFDKAGYWYQRWQQFWL